MTASRVYMMSNGPIIRSKEDIMKETGMCKRTVDERLKEIRAEMLPGGRYENLRYAVINEGRFTFVNWLVWVDYETYRVYLKEKNMRKNLPAYDPYKVAYETGMYQDKERMML